MDFGIRRRGEEHRGVALGGMKTPFMDWVEAKRKKGAFPIEGTSESV